MPNLFPIVEVSLDAPEEAEAMGTKEKFWFQDRDRGLCLYKKARPGTGEDWSEKIAAELCLAMVSATNTIELFSRLPDRRISSPAAEFAQKILKINQQRLLGRVINWKT